MEIQRHFILLNTIKDRVKAREITTKEIIKTLDQLVLEKPCALIRLAFENTMFVNKIHETYFFNADSLSQYLKREVTKVHLFIRDYCEEQVWTDFFEKYILMMREQLILCLRNLPR